MSLNERCSSRTPKAKKKTYFTNHITMSNYKSALSELVSFFKLRNFPIIGEQTSFLEELEWCVPTQSIFNQLFLLQPLLGILPKTHIETSVPSHTDISSILSNRLTRYKHIQQLHKRFWKWFLTEYITQFHKSYQCNKAFIYI